MASTIKVDNVQNQPGTNIVNKCGTTVNVGAASDNIRSAGNNLQASDGGNLISQCGTTVTLGASGDTVSLASGASQSGFGRAGSVDWQTGSIKTGTFTAVTGEGYFVNTSGGISTVNLPAGAAGSIVAIADYTRTFNSNNCTINADGSEKMGGVDAPVTLNVNGQSATFVYVDGTEGWVNVQETETSQAGATPYVEATVSGACNTLTTVDTNYKVAKFLGPGTFCVSQAGTPGGNNKADYLVVAGGASGGGACGGDGGGGGGAGGFRESYTPTVSGPYTASPVNNNCGAITLTVQGYPIVVGAGGAGIPAAAAKGNCGAVSSGLCISSAGGGGGGAQNAPTRLAQAGGSGGGGGGGGPMTGGSGNTPPTSPSQGNPGGNTTPTPDQVTGAGGGIGGAGGTGKVAGPTTGGVGGTGAETEISGAPVGYAGGGGGSSSGVAGPVGAIVGGATAGASAPGASSAGTVNTGGGSGGGAGSGGSSGNGGSGIVYIRYKFQ